MVCVRVIWLARIRNLRIFGFLDKRRIHSSRRVWVFWEVPGGLVFRYSTWGFYVWVVRGIPDFTEFQVCVGVP